MYHVKISEYKMSNYLLSVYCSISCPTSGHHTRWIIKKKHYVKELPSWKNSYCKRWKIYLLYISHHTANLHGREFPILPVSIFWQTPGNWSSVSLYMWLHMESKVCLYIITQWMRHSRTRFHLIQNKIENMLCTCVKCSSNYVSLWYFWKITINHKKN